MTEIKLPGGKTLTLYSSVKELPIELSKKFNSYLLQDAGIGNSMNDVDEHLGKLMMFVNGDKKEEALDELKNLRFNLFSMLTGFNYKSLAFGCLVKRINGIAVEDYNTESISAMISGLSEIGLTEQLVSEIIDDVKKNLIQNGSSTSLNTSETISTG